MVLMAFISLMRLIYAFCIYVKYKKNIFAEPVETLEVPSRYARGLTINRNTVEARIIRGSRKFIKL